MVGENEWFDLLPYRRGVGLGVEGRKRRRMLSGRKNDAECEE